VLACAWAFSDWVMVRDWGCFSNGLGASRLWRSASARERRGVVGQWLRLWFQVAGVGRCCLVWGAMALRFGWRGNQGFDVVFSVI